VLRLIVSDYDGTLKQSEAPLSQEFFTKVNMLSSRGGIFAVASGRPYNQLKKLLFQISNSIVFISDDGAQMMYKNCVLYKKTVELDDARTICRQAINAGFTAICALREENRTVQSIDKRKPSSTEDGLLFSCRDQICSVYSAKSSTRTMR
jgi:HAD superfamily hydrolase (TIGR01484 family)